MYINMLYIHDIYHVYIFIYIFKRNQIKNLMRCVDFVINMPKPQHLIYNVDISIEFL